MISSSFLLKRNYPKEKEHFVHIKSLFSIKYEESIIEP